MRSLLLLCALTTLALAGCGQDTKVAPTPTTKGPSEVRPVAEPVAKSEPYPHRTFATAGEALQAALVSKPRVIGLGEYHQTTPTAGIASALSRFRKQLLPGLRGTVSDLVVETWAEYGTCGQTEKVVTAKVKQETERPPQTENEIVTLLHEAKALGVRPHVLPFNCDDYAALLQDDGQGGKQVDYEKFLLLITERLRAEALAGLGQPDAIIALYGGATHNDLYPAQGMEDLSYAVELERAAPEQYVEVDLYVPEFVADDPMLAKEPWYPLLETASGPDKVLLIERGERSFIIIMRSSLAADPSPQPQ